MFNRSYLQQVAMIESECEPKRKQPMIANYTRSPLRDRESTPLPTQTASTSPTPPAASPPRPPSPRSAPAAPSPAWPAAWA